MEKLPKILNKKDFDYFEEDTFPIGAMFQGEAFDSLNGLGMKLRKSQLIKRYTIKIEVEYYPKAKINKD